ncbi:MAG: CopD family protein [Halopseudomonas sp.]|uniref:CopD family protein n=1 Tax=Halopseudomonas sp. TaxID=2901191 RepID=UPI0030039F0F
MLWILVLHIAALLFWGACLLYLPALISGIARQPDAIEQRPDPFDSIIRFIFTRVATPAALTAIIAGTLVFLINHTVTLWLMAKLTLVVGLVFVHTMQGLLLLRLEARNGKPVQLWCLLLALAAAVLMGAILWLVLAKPPLEAWL